MNSEDKSRFFDDAAALLSGGLELAAGASREAQALMRARMEKIARDMGLVDAETHDITAQMAAKAREENQRLNEKITALEAEIAALKRARDKT